MKTTIPLAAACLTFCTACAGTAPIDGSPKEVTRSVAFPTENLNGFKPVTVRAFAGSRATKNEIVNVSCKLHGPGYQVSFKSPATVAVPVYGKKTSPPTVTCTYRDKTVSKTSRLTNETEGDMFRGMIGGTGIFGPQAVLAAGVVAAAVIVVRPGQDTDEYGFKSLDIVFDD